MSKQIAVISLADIKRISIVQANGRSMAQVKAATRCDYIINSYFYSMTTGRPVGHLKAGGAVLAKTSWNCFGLTWDAGPDIRMDLVPDRGGQSYLSGVELLTPGKGPGAALSYDSAYGGTRGRSAALLAGDHLVLYCTGDGTRDARTPEGMRDELVEIGARYAAFPSLRAQGWDSGGSSQCDFGGGGTIYSSRRVAGYFCAWLRHDKKEDEPVNQYKVTPGVGVNIRKGPGTGYAKTGGYACGAVVAVLETQGGWGRTDKGWVSLDYLEAVEAAQEPDRRTDNGVPIRREYIPPGRKNRPGRANPCAYVTIHETGNFAGGADAAAHAAYLSGDAGQKDMVSWHYTVDDHAIVQHLPDAEAAYHAGDGPGGPGNATSIAVEICVNEDGDFRQAQANAAALVRLLMEEHGIPIANVVQHHHWNGKDCPKTLRATPGAWEAFLTLCQLSQAVDKLHQAGIVDSPDYWKGGAYSAANVQALIVKMAAVI